MTRRARSSVAALLLVGLAGCGDDGAAGDPAPAVRTASSGEVFNDADVAFAEAMVPHHAEAIAMVTLTQGRDLDPAVRRLAEAVREEQAPEVETMVDWLTAWDQEVPETSLDHANADHHGEGTDDLADLAAAPDAEFQQRWLAMMVEHHEATLDMARAEQESGENADAVALARSIAVSQQAQVEQMAALLGS